MKIVIVNGSNSCCYNLNSDVIKRYFELSKFDRPYFYIRELGNHSIVKRKVKHIRVDPIDNYFDVSLHDLGPELDSEEKLFTDENYFDISSILRDDVNLVTAVEELKPDNLKVVEIPEGVNWYIREEDNGFESIEESHRSWF